MYESSQLHVPPMLDLCDANLAQTFRSWRRQMAIFLLASGASEKSKAAQTAVNLNCAGVQVQEAYDQFVFDDAGDKNDPKIVLEKLAAYCEPRSSEVIESHRFWNLPYREPFDVFLTDLRSRADLCNFSDQKDRLLRDKLVFSVTGKMQELLLREKGLDLWKTIEICRSMENSVLRQQEMSMLHIDKVVCGSVSANRPASGVKHQEERKEEKHDAVLDCNFCGRSHVGKKTSCPAWGKVCRRCQGRNHFQVKCRCVQAISYSSGFEGEYRDDGGERKTSLRAVTSTDWYFDEQDNRTFLSSMTSAASGRVTALMCVGNQEVRFQLDCGADVNTISVSVNDLLTNTCSFPQNEN